MTLTAFLLILASALLHASWNFLLKSRGSSLSFNLVIQIVGFLLTLPFIIMLPVPLLSLPQQFWWMLCLSLFAEFLYCVGLSLAYKFGDISIAYPLSRSIPVLLTALLTFLFHIGKNPGSLGVAGFIVLFSGCIFLPQENFASLHWRRFLTPALCPIFIAALGTTGYTIADSIAGSMLRQAALQAGASEIVATGAYFGLIQIGLMTMLIVAVSITSPKGQFIATAKDPCSYIAGVFNFSAYFLVLISMGFVTNVSYVQAFRQIGLPIGVAAGIYFLHEKLTKMKLIGLILIIAGLLLTVL